MDISYRASATTMSMPLAVFDVNPGTLFMEAVSDSALRMERGRDQTLAVKVTTAVVCFTPSDIKLALTDFENPIEGLLLGVITVIHLCMLSFWV